ncbi:MAG TPA: hypothetical protein VN753_08615 [Terracidiphilus sp.]|nr:hypothetical protein [Terracidiphilus sp.]
MKRFLYVSILVSSFSLLMPGLTAQEIVHALCGTVSSVDLSSKTITLFQDTGSPATFNVMSSSNKRIDFDKKIAGDVTAAKEFQKQGAYVILFYFGINENRTAVALKNLGAGPFSSTSGEVTDWNGHDRKLSVRDKNGATRTFTVGPQTVAETYMGVVNGTKFDIDKGENVRIVSSRNEASPTVLFIREK